MVLEKTLESPLDAGRSSHSTLRKSTLNIHWKDWCWGWNSNTLATWCKELTHLKSPWCWERLKAGEGEDRGWDDWMASPTQWTWVWASSRSWWWTGRPGVLQSIWSQRVRQDWVTELNWLRTPDPYLLLGDPRLLVNQPRKWLSVTRARRCNCLIFVQNFYLGWWKSLGGNWW